MSGDLHPIGKLGTQIRKDRIETFQTRILEHGKKVGEPFYIDEVDFDDLLCGKQGVEGKHPNMIGIATRILIGKRAIVRTGKYRNSTREGSNRRLIFQYVLSRGVVDQRWVVKELEGEDGFGLFQGDRVKPIMWLRDMTNMRELLQDVAYAHNQTLPQEEE